MNAKDSDCRKWHYLRHNLRSSSPTNMLFFDTETRSIPVEGNENATIQVLRLWTAISCRMSKGKQSRQRKHAGTTCEEFWRMVDSLLSERRPLWCFAHNIGFDLTVLNFWREMECGHYVLEHGLARLDCKDGYKPVKPWKGFAVLDDPPTILHVRDGKRFRGLLMVDTYNYFRCSLAKLGESIGIAKYPMPDANSSNDTMLRYCHRDTEIVQKAIVGLSQFVVDSDLGMFRYTSPAQAFSAFRHRFMGHKILVHGSTDALALEREAYYGGRCEPFFVGGIVSEQNLTDRFFAGQKSKLDSERLGPVYVLDFQSFYPSVMINSLFPASISSYTVDPSYSAVKLALSTNLIIARIRINSVSESFPVRKDGKVFFARGKFTTALCGPELLRAFQTNSVHSIGAVAVYNGLPLFTSYVREFWEMRKSYKSMGNLAYAEMCKLMLNSLAGKFGQRGHRWVDAPDVDAPFPWGLWAYRDTAKQTSEHFRSLAWSVERHTEVGESIDSCPAISAYVTSYAREKLLSAIRTANTGSVYYVDTDSLHVSGAGYVALNAAGLVRDGELGYLRLIGTYDTAEYRGIKDYTIGETAVISGIKVAAEKLRDRFYRQPQFQRLRSVLSGPPPSGIRVDMVTIDRSKGMDIGRILHDGCVEPITLDE